MARQRRDPDEPVMPREAVSLSQVARDAPRPTKARGAGGKAATGWAGKGAREGREPSRGKRDEGGGGPGTQAAPKKARRGWSPQARAIAMLARREHSQAELVRKLQEKGVEPGEAQRVVQELAELGLQSDQRFLESRVRQRVGGGYGPGRARVDLARHGLDEDAVDRAVSEPGERWEQGAYDLIERRFGPSPLPFEVRQKALGLLVRRGFSFDQAQQVIRQPRPEVDPGQDA